jgi:hypothetical protein
MNSEIGGLRSDMNSEIGGLRSDMNSEIGGLRSDMNSEIGGLRSDMNSEFGRLRSDTDSRFEGVHVEIAGLKDDLASAKVWALTLYIALAAVNLGTLARGFGWI